MGRETHWMKRGDAEPQRASLDYDWSSGGDLPDSENFSTMGHLVLKDECGFLHHLYTSRL
eukprot:12943541-Heterocapsa_arctica.AAC.1